MKPSTHSTQLGLCVNRPNPSSKTMPQNAGQIVDAFFIRTGLKTYECKQCKKVYKKSRSSNENLLSHLRRVRPGFEKLMDGDEAKLQTTLQKHFVLGRSRHTYGWFRLIIDNFLPFVTVEKESVRQHVKYHRVSTTSFMKNLSELTKLVELKASDLLQSSFALVFDGWSCTSTHYIGVFASFLSQSNHGYDNRLIAFSPLEDESRLNAEEHYEFISNVLQLYGKARENVSCLVGNNCSTNNSIARRAEVLLVGSAGHRFNQAVGIILKNEEVLLDMINKLMHKLKSLIVNVGLVKVTGYRPKTRNVTRWSSSFEMVRRCKQVREAVKQLEAPDVDNLLLTTAQNRRVDVLMSKLKDLESVSKLLQSEDTTLADVRRVFDHVIDTYPSSVVKLLGTSDIVACPTFESALVKIQSGNSGALSTEELSQVSQFAVHVRSNDVDNDALSFAEGAFKRQRTLSAGGATSYRDLRFILPTSNTCERLFLAAGYALIGRRRRISPENFESQVSLNFNSDLWDERDINKIL